MMVKHLKYCLVQVRYDAIHVVLRSCPDAPLFQPYTLRCITCVHVPQHEELAAMESLPSLSPRDLRNRVLAKGKVKCAKAQGDRKEERPPASRLSLVKSASSYLKDSASTPESIESGR
eukprot:3269248-Prymnesium_polylepis.2